MRLPPHQRVSDLLHEIADLVQQADTYLVESSLSPRPVSGLGKAKSRPPTGPRPFNKPGAGKKADRSTLFKSLEKPSKRASLSEPHAASSIENRMRKMREKLAKPERDVLRAKRERKQRSRYQAGKLTVGAPKKSLGTRLRKR